MVPPVMGSFSNRDTQPFSSDGNPLTQRQSGCGSRPLKTRVHGLPDGLVVKTLVSNKEVRVHPCQELRSHMPPGLKTKLKT